MKNVVTTKLEEIEVTLDVEDALTMSSYQDKWYVRINGIIIYPQKDKYSNTLNRATHELARPIFGIVVKALSTALNYVRCEQCGMYKESTDKYKVCFDDAEDKVESYYTSILCKACIPIIKEQEGTIKVEAIE